MDTLAVQKILVPIDFSDASMNALHTAIKMAKRQHAQLILLHVININPLLDIDDDKMINDLNLQNHIETHHNNLRKLADKTTNEEFIDCRTCIRTGQVHAEIVRAAIDFYADIIIMGKQGVSGISEFLIGSNTFNVLKNAFCPVLTIPAHQKFEDFKTVVYPIRPVIGAIEKYDLARNIIKENNADLVVIGLLENTDKKSFETLNTETAKLNKKLKEDKMEAQTYFYFCNSIAEKVLEKTSEFMADLLIIPATIDRQIQDYVIGPFAKQIIHYAKVPVLSIRTKSSKNINSTNNFNSQYQTSMLGII
ncbi:universal stress protein [Arcicella rosea]|uniref:Nucleotide-binding universal stress UspA family protein n=1 Tax=Arcicella rosea TaxID=502909 RepID=A0A841EVP5_9BACT|nr:universal stress protein [Arcicella rosea]MBB6005489.1 nucleotide-binding universal stress UspA family protein [Arcicella rosea]